MCRVFKSTKVFTRDLFSNKVFLPLELIRVYNFKGFSVKGNEIV